MAVRKCLIFGVVVSVMLCLIPSIGLAEDGCKKQNARIKELGDAIFDPEVCGGYEACQFGELVGTLNGSISFRRGLDWIEFVADDTALVIWADSEIETKKGELWIQTRCILHLAVPGLACHMAIWGGTGDYADTTGWLAFAPISLASPDTAAGGTFVVKGEICSAEE